MRAIPSELTSSEDHVTGLACPDCCGVLAVELEGSHGTLRFRCRIGHTYSTEEVIIGKEKLLEHRLWDAATTLDELATLLGELIASGRADRHRDEYEARRERVVEQRDRLRAIIEQNAPTAVGSGIAPELGAE